MAGKKFDITKFAATLPEAVPESSTREQIEYIDEAKLSGDGENFYSMEGIEALAHYSSRCVFAPTLMTRAATSWSAVTGA